MRKLYEKNKILFAVLWILVYCLVMAPIRGTYGDENVISLLALGILGMGALIFVKANHLEEDYGLNTWPKNTRRFLYFIPLWVLVTGNLWGGIAPALQGIDLIIAMLSMALVGYLEEIIFRGFLFKALLESNSEKVAIIISAVTFGIGHLLNLLSGQATLETVIQVIYAIVWGFVFTFVFYKSGSLLPCIIAHSLIDVFSKVAAANELLSWVYIGATIVVGIAYCIYLAKCKSETDTILA